MQQTQKDILLRDVVSISDGTIATLTGLRDVSAIEEIHQDWISFLDKNPLEFSYKGWTWSTSWRAFTLYCKRIKLKGRTQ